MKPETMFIYNSLFDVAAKNHYPHFKSFWVKSLENKQIKTMKLTS